MIRYKIKLLDGKFTSDLELNYTVHGENILNSFEYVFWYVTLKQAKVTPWHVLVNSSPKIRVETINYFEEHF